MMNNIRFDNITVHDIYEDLDLPGFIESSK